MSLLFAIALTFWSLYTTVGYLIETYTALPFWDQWLYALPEDASTNLFQHHSEHLIILGRLGFLIDLIFFRGSNVFNFATIMLSQILLIIMLGAICALGTGRRIDLIATSVAAVFLLSLNHFYNFTWGFQTSFVGVFALTTASFLVFVQGRTTLGNTCAASALAFLASFTLANGVLAFPILLIMSFILDRPRKHIVLIAAIALIAVLILWRVSFSKSVHAANLEDLPIFCSYFLTYLGAPIAELLKFGDPKVIGFIALILSLSMVMPKLVRRASIHKGDLVLCRNSGFCYWYGFRYHSWTIQTWNNRGAKFPSLCNTCPAAMVLFIAMGLPCCIEKK